MTVLLFLLLLPAAVWLLGAVFGLLDSSDPAATLARIAVRGLPFMAAALVFGEQAAGPALAAVATVFAAHLLWTWLVQLSIRRGWLD